VLTWEGGAIVDAEKAEEYCGDLYERPGDYPGGRG
jgi:hypothetical protein